MGWMHIGWFGRKSPATQPQKTPEGDKKPRSIWSRIKAAFNPWHHGRPIQKPSTSIPNPEQAKKAANLAYKTLKQSKVTVTDSITDSADFEAMTAKMKPRKAVAYIHKQLQTRETPTRNLLTDLLTDRFRSDEIPEYIAEGCTPILKKSPNWLDNLNTTNANKAKIFATKFPAYDGIKHPLDRADFEDIAKYGKFKFTLTEHQQIRSMEISAGNKHFAYTSGTLSFARKLIDTRHVENKKKMSEEESFKDMDITKDLYDQIMTTQM